MAHFIMHDVTENHKKIRIRVGVVLLSGNKVLLVEHQKDGRYYWLLPGGGLNYGEKIEECARREIKEETNLTINLGKFLFLSESIAPDGSRHLLNLFFLGQIEGGMEDMEVGKEARLKSLAFIDFEELDKMEIHPPMGRLLKQILKSGVASDPENRALFLGNLWTT
jgi:8-oxo-dGTP diphosphatase